MKNSGDRLNWGEREMYVVSVCFSYWCGLNVCIRVSITVGWALAQGCRLSQPSGTAVGVLSVWPVVLGCIPLLLIQLHQSNQKHHCYFRPQFLWLFDLRTRLQHEWNQPPGGLEPFTHITISWSQFGSLCWKLNACSICGKVANV